MATKRITYTQALEELKNIINQIENGDLDIDEIAKKIKRAKELFDFCFTKLHQIKTDIDKIVSEDFQNKNE